LCAAQENYIAAKTPLASQNSAAEIEKLVDGGEHRLAVADIITQVDEPVAFLKTLADCVMQADEAARLGMDGGNGPDPPGTPQPGKISFRSCSVCRADLVALEGSGCQQLLYPLGCGGLVDPLDGGELTHETVERRLIDLSLAVGLLRLTRVAVEVTHYLGDRSRVAGGDFGLVFLGAPTPHRALGARSTAQFSESRIHLLAARQPAKAGRLGLGERHTQCHPILVEMDDEHVQRMAGYLLDLNADDLADAVRRIHNKITGGKWRFVGIHIHLS
jgi:hypothetical protein